MAAMNSSVLACNYVISGASESSKKLLSMPASASMTVSHQRAVQSVRAQRCEAEERSEGRRAALLGLAGVLFTSAVTASSANASVFDEYLEKSKANKVCCSSICGSMITNYYNFLLLNLFVNVPLAAPEP